MSDKEHHRKHREGTLRLYKRILDDASEYRESFPEDSLETYCKIANRSRRSVQRALSWYETSWRELKKASG